MYIYHCSKKLQKWFPLIDNATAEAFRGIADVLNSALPEKDLMKRYETLNGTHWNPICQTTHGDTFTAAEHIRVTPACPQSAQMWPCDVTDLLQPLNEVLLVQQSRACVQLKGANLRQSASAWRIAVNEKSPKAKSNMSQVRSKFILAS